MIDKKTEISLKSTLHKVKKNVSSSKTTIIPPERINYLREIAEIVRTYHHRVKDQAALIRNAWQLIKNIALLRNDGEEGSRNATISFFLIKEGGNQRTN